MDLHFQGLKDSYFAGMEQYEERQTAYSVNQFRELRNLIQSTAESQNALFCSDFRSYLCLSGEIRTLSFLLVDRNNNFRNLRIISTTPTQSSSYFITVDIFDVEFVIIKKGEIERISKEQRFLAGATPKERFSLS
ncbi:hypothetical protein Lal_00043246, partial [Lupinus albus]